MAETAEQAEIRALKEEVARLKKTRAAVVKALGRALASGTTTPDPEELARAAARREQGAEPTPGRARGRQFDPMAATREDFRVFVGDHAHQFGPLL